MTQPLTPPTKDGRDPTGQALVNDAPAGRRPTGFDPSRDNPIALWEVLIELESAETADRENEADSHCGAYGTSTAADYREQIRAKFEDIGRAYVAAFEPSKAVEPSDCPRAPSPFRYCPDCDGSFPCHVPGAKRNG